MIFFFDPTILILILLMVIVGGGYIILSNISTIILAIVVFFIVLYGIYTIFIPEDSDPNISGGIVRILRGLIYITISFYITISSESLILLYLTCWLSFKPVNFSSPSGSLMQLSKYGNLRFVLLLNISPYFSN